MKRLFIILICVVILQCSVFSVYGESARSMINVSAHNAAIVELNSGSIICGKAEHERASMASTTKIMTALLLCELADLDAEITITHEMVAVEGTSMGLRVGDKAHYRDLLYGMLLASGNDAANATAISISGSTTNFAELMNKRAEQIGMKNTHFVTPSGLDDEEHYSTAYDMALLACEAMRNSEFVSACSSKTATLEYGNPPYRRTLTNHNKLLRMYSGCVGVKTGFTKKSGRCLVSCAIRDGRGVVAVTLKAPNDWDDHVAMLDYGISQLETRTLRLPDLPNLTVVGGTYDSVKVNAVSPELSLLSEDFGNLSTNITMHDVVFAPIYEGDTVGTVEWQINGVTVAGTDIVVSSDVETECNLIRRDCMYWFRRMLSA